MQGCENPHARDALATVDGRLRGTLLGVASQPCMPLSVEGHAHRLIAEASDKENLGLMYIWWVLGRALVVGAGGSRRRCGGRGSCGPCAALRHLSRWMPWF